MWFRRKPEETYNEQLLREAGLGAPTVEPQSPDPLRGRYPAQSGWGAIFGMPARPDEWDVHATADAPDVQGDNVEFATLSSGDVIVDVEQGDGDLSPLADAVEKQLAPPYRALGTRQTATLWAVAARRIDLRSLTCDGDELEVIARDGERTVTIDGARSAAEIPEIAESGDYVARGARLDGDLWEIRVERL